MEVHVYKQHSSHVKQMKFKINKWRLHMCIHSYIFLPGWNCMFVRPWNCRFRCRLSAHSESRYESLLSCSSFCGIHHTHRPITRRLEMGVEFGGESGDNAPVAMG